MTKYARFALLIVMVLSASTAIADNYLTVDVGSLEPEVAIAGEQKAGISFGFGFGRQMTEQLALELTYRHAANGSTATSGILSTHSKWTSDALDLSLIGQLRLTDSFSVLAKVGAQYVHGDQFVDTTDSTAVAPTPSVTRNSEAKWSGFTPVIGLGAGFAINDKMDVRAMFEHVTGTEGLESAQLISIGLVHRF